MLRTTIDNKKWSLRSTEILTISWSLSCFAFVLISALMLTLLPHTAPLFESCFPSYICYFLYCCYTTLQPPCRCQPRRSPRAALRVVLAFMPPNARTLPFNLLSSLAAASAALSPPSPISLTMLLKILKSILNFLILRLKWWIFCYKRIK